MWPSDAARNYCIARDATDVFSVRRVTHYFPGLKLNNSNSEAGYDAIDRDGKRVEIKGRSDTAAAYLQVSRIHWDYLLLFRFSAEYELLEALKIPQDLALEVGTAKKIKVKPRLLKFYLPKTP